ncbi:MAG: serine acetyltransferase [Verrucomicrobia bacterium]|nr:serine acetyltransferase [Verrucomicrobiota bacterium]MDA1087932.1 serine acetyltransferase [Verrucomicrobiota bacterium]
MNDSAQAAAEATGLFALLRSDFQAKADWVYGERTAKTMLKAVLTDGSSAMILYRLMQASQRCGLSPLAMIFNKLNVIFGSCTIGRRAQFGPGFVVIHSHGIVINSAVVGGADIRLEHQVTIGAERRQTPRLGNDVFVGAGARILGGVRIGSHVQIGANAVVLDDVPDHCTAVGVPARVIEREAKS